MAASSNPSYFQSDLPDPALAPKEKATIAFIDSIIECHMAETGTDSAVPLLVIESSIRSGASKEIVEYICKTSKTLKTFIKVRKHLWKADKASQQNLVVLKQSNELRHMFYYICSYIDGLCQTWHSPGVALKDISSVLTEHFRNIKRDIIGRGYDKLKNFLLSFPLLFEMVSHDPRRVAVDDVQFRSQVTIVDDVMLLPPFLEGLGTVTEFLKDKACGFIRCNSNGQSAYFPLLVVQPPSVKKSQQFHFEAVLSSRFLNGRSRNKWRVYKMTPYQGQSGQPTVSASPLVANVPSASEPVSSSGPLGKNSDEPTASLNSSIENNFCPYLAPPADVQGLEEPVENCPQIEASRPEPSISEPALPQPPTTLSSLADIAKSISNSSATENLSCTASRPRCPSETDPRPAIPAAEPTRPKILPIAHLTASAAVPKAASSSSVRKRAVETRDAACQTDFWEAEDMLLRLLRDSDLLRLVRAMQRNE